MGQGSHRLKFWKGKKYMINGDLNMKTHTLNDKKKNPNSNYLGHKNVHVKRRHGFLETVVVMHKSPKKILN